MSDQVKESLSVLQTYAWGEFSSLPTIFPPLLRLELMR